MILSDVLEKMFRVAYCRDAITPGTRDALLYGQLQEGLSHHLVAIYKGTFYAKLRIAEGNMYIPATWRDNDDGQLTADHRQGLTQRD